MVLPTVVEILMGAEKKPEMLLRQPVEAQMATRQLGQYERHSKWNTLLERCLPQWGFPGPLVQSLGLIAHLLLRLSIPMILAGR